jgi:hypothetical protein
VDPVARDILEAVKYARSPSPAGPPIVDITPSARRLTESLRSIGYDFVTAVADIVDNSVSAGAQLVDITVGFAGLDSRVVIRDDGCGMSAGELGEALRFGTRRGYDAGELGRFGLGLKTASMSQARRITVATRRSPQYRRVSALTLDLDRIAEVDRWEVGEPDDDRHASLLDDGPGTVVVWERLDRIVPVDKADSGWTRRRLAQLAVRTSEYLGMVFHRFLEGTARREGPLAITVNGEKVRPWNPFAPDEPHRQLPLAMEFELDDGSRGGVVTFTPAVLPPRSRFSSLTEFERLGGPQRWNRQQGLYVYRADRMVQGGGWSGLRAIDEHTKLARAAIDFDTGLDELFQINVAKMRVALPSAIRTQLERPVNELARLAENVYRRSEGRATGAPPVGEVVARSNPMAGVALRAAAMETGDYEALVRILERLRLRAPEVTDALGL